MKKSLRAGLQQRYNFMPQGFTADPMLEQRMELKGFP
jgi:hypothetical protein